MKAKHRKILEAVFATPVQASIVFADIEAMVINLGGEVREGSGSRIAFDMGDGTRLYLHRPHPGKEAKRYQVREVRNWLETRGIKP